METIRVNSHTFSELVNSLNLDYQTVARTVDIDVVVTNEQMKKLVTWVVYSCLNGPVGKGKYIEINGSRINGAELHFASNKQIGKLCQIVKLVLPTGINCIMMEKYGEYYPSQRFLEDHPISKI